MFEVKDELTLENVLKRIGEQDIFHAYCPNFKQVGKKFVAELNRSEKETLPSAVIEWHNNRLWYKDFGLPDKALDCFGYIQSKYGMSFRQALGIVNLDFNLGLKPIEVYRPSLNYVGLPDIFTRDSQKGSVRGEFTIIKPQRREWKVCDRKFWFDDFKITKDTLEAFNVFPIKWYYNNGYLIFSDRLAYCYFIDKEDSVNYYKIYQPYSKVFKWISNCKARHYQGYNQLPLSGDLLIITKSLKDVMLLYQLGYSSIAPGSESHQIDDDFMRLLRRRFEKIIIFFDNDSAGEKGANNINYHHGTESIFIPKEFGVKDISDYVKMTNLDSGRELMSSLVGSIN